jgi:hypothetical protein
MRCRNHGSNPHRIANADFQINSRRAFRSFDRFMFGPCRLSHGVGAVLANDSKEEIA